MSRDNRDFLIMLVPNVMALAIGIISTLLIQSFMQDHNKYPRQDEFDHYNCAYDLHHGNRLSYDCWQHEYYLHAGIDKGFEDK